MAKIKYETKAYYKIDDELHYRTERGIQKIEVRNILFDEESQEWKYTFDKTVVDIPFEEAHSDDIHLVKKSCPECRSKGSREKTKLRCTNSDCTMRLFDGLTYDLSSHTVIAPEPSISIEDKENITKRVYSVGRNDWFYFFDNGAMKTSDEIEL